MKAAPHHFRRVCSLLWLATVAFLQAEPTTVTTVDQIEAKAPGGWYVANRAPLQPGGLLRLPPGSIRPEGWLRQMLLDERQGMTGRLREISPWLDFTKSSWADKEGRGRMGWEELPYWLKGYGDLGYVLHDESIIAEAKKWIEAVMASQREDGWFGPRELLTSLNGKPDLWPHMVMLNILQSYYEYSGDPRVIAVMGNYLKWENQLPPTAFGEGYWPRLRAGDNVESAHWFYNRTGQKWALDLAARIHANMARWDQDVVNWHNVNIAQGFRASAVYSAQSRLPEHLQAAERNYRKVMDLFGQFPGGGFAGDENCRPGYNDPRQGFETCGIVEFMHSFQMLTRISGRPLWADRCEDIAFNSFPASMTPDQRSLHYLTCANQVQLDRHNKAPGIQNGGTMFSYSPFEAYRCCQHNVSHGWPYYAEEMWLATHDAGLCASLYAASAVTANVGAGRGETVTVTESTDYPFSDTIQFRLATVRPVAFPLYLRLPAWCTAPQVEVNHCPRRVGPQPRGYLVINRLWREGDVVTLRLPMSVTVKTWAANKNSVSVNHGPLTFALKITEDWRSYGKNAQWPEWEVLPASSWNYGLVLPERNPSRAFTVIREPGRLAAQPFTPQTVPIRLVASARKIPAWQTDRNHLVNPLQASPARSAEPVEKVTLIPMGAARLRIASFPTIGTGSNATEWIAPARPKAAAYKVSASHVHESDSLDALADGLEPAKSNDQLLPRFTWWPRLGSTEWVQYDFPAASPVQSVSVYWFDDTGAGRCRVPAQWRVLALVGQAWVPVGGAPVYGTAKDAWNTARFAPVTTTALRLEVGLQAGFSGGILEWKLVE